MRKLLASAGGNLLVILVGSSLTANSYCNSVNLDFDVGVLALHIFLGLAQARIGILIGTGGKLCAVIAHNSIAANQNLMKPFYIVCWLDVYWSRGTVWLARCLFCAGSLL